MKKKSLLILSAVIALFLQGCQSRQEGMREPPTVPVVAASPVVKDITVYLESIGTLNPSILMEIRPQVDGILSEVLITQGQWVAPGTPLFKIDAKPFEIKVQEAEAQLKSDGAIVQAAQKKFARFKPLFEKELVSQSEWENLEAELEKAQAALALSEARLNGAKLDLEYCIIASPIAGKVGKLDVHPGTLVARGQLEPLAIVSQIDPLLVEFNLTEKELPKLAVEMIQFEVKTLCTTDACKKGEITFLDNHFDPATGLILVRGKVLNSDYSLFPGQSVQVRLPVAVNANALIIPQKAIRYNQEGPYIYVIQPDKTVVVRQLVLGDEQGDDQIVKEGIEPSEQLIIDGHLRLSPGIKVEVKS